MRNDAERALVREAAQRVLAGHGLMTIARDWNRRGRLRRAAQGTPVRPRRVRAPEDRPWLTTAPSCGASGATTGYSRTKRQRAADVLGAMEQSGKPITFPAVARRAGVSVSLLYAVPDLASRIATARGRQRQAGTERAWRLPARSLVTERSLRAELSNTKERAHRLAEELAVLRDRLSRHLGAAGDMARGEALSPLLEQLEQRAAELETDNHRHRQRIAQLEAEARELTETLHAARAMNRELMSELNRSASDENARRPSRKRT